MAEKAMSVFFMPARLASAPGRHLKKKLMGSDPIKKSLRKA